MTTPARNIPMMRRLAQLDRDLRAASECPVCGLPQEGFRKTFGGQTLDTLDASGTAAERFVGGSPANYEDAGLCQCERVELCNGKQRIARHLTRRAVLENIELDGRGHFVSLTIRQVIGVVTVTADMFPFPVTGWVHAPKLSDTPLFFELVKAPNQAEINDSGARMERAFAEAS